MSGPLPPSLPPPPPLLLMSLECLFRVILTSPAAFQSSLFKWPPYDLFLPTCYHQVFKFTLITLLRTIWLQVSMALDDDIVLFYAKNKCNILLWLGGFMVLWHKTACCDTMSHKDTFDCPNLQTRRCISMLSLLLNYRIFETRFKLH